MKFPFRNPEDIVTGEFHHASSWLQSAAGLVEWRRNKTHDWVGADLALGTQRFIVLFYIWGIFLYLGLEKEKVLVLQKQMDIILTLTQE